MTSISNRRARTTERRRWWFLSMVFLGMMSVQVFGQFREGYATEQFPSGVAAAPNPARLHGSNQTYHVLLAMAAVIVAGRLLGIVFRRFGQPGVVAEIVAGVLLGPSFLGWLSPTAYAYLLPADIAPFLHVIAQFGVILYMFLVGLELNTGLFRERGKAVVAISQASIAVPFVLGAGLAFPAYSRWGTNEVSLTVFTLFFGVSLSVTAFPVLARILSERGLSRTPLGTTALACAAIGDVTAWCLLAFVVSVAQAKVGGALLTVLLAAAYITFMWGAVRPLMARLVKRYDDRTALAHGMIAFVFVALLLSSLATELIGIHAIFGAFLLGAVIPHDSRIAREFIQKLEDIVGVLFLPAFFAFTGMRTEIGLVSGFDQIVFCVIIILAATVGKFAGSTLAGRIAGMGWQDSSAIGILMNTRGLMELIVLNIGLDLGVISPTLFAMLVVMALVTTFATAPLLDLLMWRFGRTQEQ